MHVLLVTEAFEGLGHIAPWRALVQQLSAQAIQVSIACPEPSEAQVILGLDSAACHQAWWPSMHAGAQQATACCWEELLWSLGYGSSVATKACLKQWRHLFSTVKPDVLLADYAPLAMLTAKSMGIPIIEAGGGFCVPPVTKDEPIWLPLMKQDLTLQHNQATGELRSLGTKLTLVLNQALLETGLTYRLTWLGDLYSVAQSRCITSDARLDHYLELRLPGTVLHVGALAISNFGASPLDVATSWAESKQGRKRVACYLKENTPELNRLLDELVFLADSEVLWLGQISSKFTEQIRHWESKPHLHFPNIALNLSSVLPLADVLLTNGGIHTLSHALHQQCKCILLPMQTEQASTAIRLATHPLIRILTSPEDLDELLHSYTANKEVSSRVDLDDAEATLINLIIQNSKY